MSDDPILAALKGAIDRDPRNGHLWLHYGELLEKADRTEEALRAIRTASEMEATAAQALPVLIRLMRQQGHWTEALLRAEKALQESEDPAIRAELERIQAHLALPDSEATQPKRLAPAQVEPEPTDSDDWAKQFDWGDLHITLDDVVGMEDVKRQIRLRMIAPFQQPEVYSAFGREGGGGLLRYGPPGCGTTFIARATAGELGARFVSISIHEIVDKYWGESEKLVHALFEDARKNKPTVLFFDEFDALGSKRGGTSQFWKTLVDHLLQEMDGVDGGNSEILPPPDVEGRIQLLKTHGNRLPGFDSIDTKRIAKATPLFTGADMRALCEMAAEVPLERSLETGEVCPVGQRDFELALQASNSTALEWLSMARNYARYSNEGGHYDPLVQYLKKIKKW